MQPEAAPRSGPGLQPVFPAPPPDWGCGPTKPVKGGKGVCPRPDRGYLIGANGSAPPAGIRVERTGPRVLDCAAPAGAPESEPSLLYRGGAVLTGLLDISVWGIVAYTPRGHAPDHHLRHRLSASPQGAPGPRSASSRQPPDALLALAHHRHGHEAVDGGAPQAPRLRGVGAGSPQSAPGRHRQAAARGHRALPQGGRQRGDAPALRAWRAGRLDRAEPLHALVEQGLLPDARHRRCALRTHRPDGVGDPDALDSGARGRSHQRDRSLVGLPKLRDPRHVHQHHPLRPAHRGRRAAQQPTTPSRAPPSSRRSGGSSMPAGSTSGFCRVWASPG